MQGGQPQPERGVPSTFPLETLSVDSMAFRFSETHSNLDLMMQDLVLHYPETLTVLSLVVYNAQTRQR